MNRAALALFLLCVSCSPVQPDPEAATRRSNAIARADRELQYHRYSLVTVGEGPYQTAIKLDTQTGASWTFQTFDSSWTTLDYQTNK